MSGRQPSRYPSSPDSQSPLDKEAESYQRIAEFGLEFDDNKHQLRQLVDV